MTSSAPAKTFAEAILHAANMLPFNDALSNGLLITLALLTGRAIFLTHRIRKMAERYTALLEQERQEEETI